MSTVALRFSPAAEHVRTARLVAVSVARRAGLGEEQLDAIRLSVGEMCARAVRRCGDTGVTEPMLVEVDDAGPRLEIVVMLIFASVTAKIQAAGPPRKQL